MPVPPVGSEKRRTWVLRTLARRGAALARLGKLDDAVVDYETAASIAPDDAKLKADLGALRAKAHDAKHRPHFAKEDLPDGVEPVLDSESAPPTADGSHQAALD